MTIRPPITRIALCCPGKPLLPDRADAVLALAAAEFPQLDLAFHRQCFATHGHFAGDDSTRLAALLELANDPAVDAVWFAMGGYGSNRIVQEMLDGLGDAAANKTFLGYSDCGTLLGALYRNGIGWPVHGPLAGDIRREGGDDAVRRVLGYFAGDHTGLDPALDHRPAVAFNLMTLHLYAVDRLFFHITQHLHGVAGLRLGRVSDVPENDRPFGYDAQEIAQYWCAKAGIPYLGRADIGHDAANKIVPFGLA
jgi:muramoyltetrapeptide carboxypeptidase